MFFVRMLVCMVMLNSLLVPPSVRAASTSVVISELQTGSTTTGTQEFVELYNLSEQSINLAGWFLEYKSATSAETATAWKKYATLSGTVPAHGFYLISNYLPADATLVTTGMSGTAGNIRIKDNTGAIIDKLGYGATANAAETAPADAPSAGQSLERLPGRLIEDGGNAVDTDDNSKDFITRPTPLPQSINSTVEMPVSTDPAQPGVGEEPAEQPVRQYPAIQISELLVDPQTPLTDADDEFIELYNPNDTIADVTGYTLRTGSNFHDYYVLPSMLLEPHAYAVIYSSESHLSLPNTGGATQIIDPLGAVIDQTATYPIADPGQSWVWFDAAWVWTLQTTPGQDNVFVQPIVATKTTKAKTASTQKATTKKPKKAATSKSRKNAKAGATKVKSASTSPATRHLQPATWLIIALIGLTMVYAIYEFRYDIQNHFARLRRN